MFANASARRLLLVTVLAVTVSLGWTARPAAARQDFHRAGRAVQMAAGASRWATEGTGLWALAVHFLQSVLAGEGSSMDPLGGH